jgi:ribosomal-protein-alanine N-acetyltransferase
MRRHSTQFSIRPMSDASALAIARWRYPPPYDFYNAADDDPDLADLLSAGFRAGRYFEVVDETGEVVGFFEFKAGHDPIEIGLGLRPDLTGKGLGLAFVQAGMDFARDHFGVSALSLEVATFNTRARLVYERAGFVPGETYLRRVLGRDQEFLRMRADLS